MQSYINSSSICGVSMHSWYRRCTSHVAIMACFFLVLTTLTGCTAGPSGRESGWWGSKQDRSIISDEDIRRFVAGTRPLLHDAETHFRRGFHSQSQGRHSLAVEEFRRALQLNPEHTRALNALGISSDHLGDYETAVDSYKAALALDPELDFVHNNLGYSYLIQGNYTRAVSSFEKAVALDGDNELYRNNLGMAHARKGSFRQALALFQEQPEQAGTSGLMAGDEAGEDRKKTSGGSAAVEAVLPHPIFEAVAMPEADAEVTRERPLKFKAESVSAVVAAKEAGREQPPAARGTNGPVLEQIVAEKNPETGSGTEQPEPVVREHHIRKEVSREIRYVVQAAAYEYQENASQGYFRMLQNGYDAYINAPGPGSRFYRLRVGPYDSMEKAGEVSRELARIKNTGPFATIENRDVPAWEKKSSAADILQNDEDQVIMGDILLEVFNGNGISGMAARMRDYLQTQGVRVVRIRNADHFQYPRTVIYYRPGYSEAAELLAERLPVDCEIIRVDPLAMPGAKTRMIIGKDQAARSMMQALLDD